VRRYAVAVAVLAMLSVGCGEPSSWETYQDDGRTFTDLCVRDKLEKLNAIDHEQPSEGAVIALIEFCERQYPGPERVEVEP
jgi:hypothetical protein